MTTSPLRVAFAGTPEFAAAALAAVHGAGFHVPLVLTQPDRPAGRGLKLVASAVKSLAAALGLPVAQPRSLRLDGKYPDDAAQAQARLAEARPDVLVVAAYGLLLPPWVLALPPAGCLNIHASLLPRWRGAAPIHRAIEAGDAESGITLMQMDEGLDTGDMLLVARTPIGADDTTATLQDRLARLGAALVVDGLRAAESGTLRRVPQPAAGVTYAHKITKGEATLDWSAPAAAIERRVRAFDPFPGASFACAGEVVKLWRAQVLPRGAAPPGTVLQADARGVVVACGEDALALLEVQRPGGRRLPAAAWLQAHPLAVGQALS